MRRAPLTWLARIERRFDRDASMVALSGPYRYYDWDLWGRLLIRAYDFTLAPATQLLVKHMLRIGTIFYGGNFAVRRAALEEIGGFDTSIELHGEDTNVGRRLFKTVRCEKNWPAIKRAAQQRGRGAHALPQRLVGCLTEGKSQKAKGKKRLLIEA